MEERSRWSSWSEGGSTALGPLLEVATSPAFAGADLLLSQVTRPCRRKEFGGKLVELFHKPYFFKSNY